MDRISEHLEPMNRIAKASPLGPVIEPNTTNKANILGPSPLAITKRTHPFRDVRLVRHDLIDGVAPVGRRL
jgi:hypothetical protein